MIVQGFRVPAVGQLVAPLGHWDALAIVARELVLSVNEGRQKNCFFLLLVKKGGGGLGQSKKPLSENTQIFLTKEGGSHLIQKRFIRFFGTICQKWGFHIKKLAVFFFTIFGRKGGAGPS